MEKTYKENLIIKGNLIHNNKYSYSLLPEILNSRSKVKIICPNHGIFEQKPNNHLSGYGCFDCGIFSKGENKIINILTNLNIEFIKQKKFDNCKDVLELPFDFYLPDKNLCIEFDGIQHFKPIDYFGGEKNFHYIVKHDNIKNDFCHDNNINLLRIKYNENIEEKLNFLYIT